MLNIIIQFCLREIWLMLLLAIGIFVGGRFANQAVGIEVAPNAGKNQVLVRTPWPGRAPQEVEGQVTNPLGRSLSAVPGAESVRGKSRFGCSLVLVTFEDEIDIDWARGRVLDELSGAAAQLPDGVVPHLGPKATGPGRADY